METKKLKEELSFITEYFQLSNTIADNHRLQISTVLEAWKEACLCTQVEKNKVIPYETISSLSHRAEMKKSSGQVNIYSSPEWSAELTYQKLVRILQFVFVLIF